MGAGRARGATLMVVAGLALAGCATEADPDDQTLQDAVAAVDEAAVDIEEEATRDGEDGEPDAYGDDGYLDGLQDDCVDGDMRACDLLYLLSPPGSQYERLATGCGGPEPGDVFCAPETEVDEDGYSPADNPGLDVLADDCTSGDLTACDLLYQIAPIDSDYEDLGYSCGGRRPEGGPDVDCRSGVAA
jgi:hypothetical protein